MEDLHKSLAPSAMARMPFARQLKFDDADFMALRGNSLIVPGGDVCGAIYDSKLRRLFLAL